jgi:hypothetical protein
MSKSRKSELSPSITKGSNAIDLGKNSGIDMGQKSQPSITSGGIGITQEVTNVGGLSVSAGANIDITPIDFGVNINPSEGTISVATEAELPGGLLGISGGIEIDTNTGEIIGGSIGGEVGGLGINVSNSEKGGFGIEFTVQIPGTPIEISLGFGFPPAKEEPTPTPTPTPTVPITLENPFPPVPPPTIDPNCRYWVKLKTIQKNTFSWDDGKIVPSNFNYETPDLYAKYAVSLSGATFSFISSNVTYAIIGSRGNRTFVYDKNIPSINAIVFSSNFYIASKGFSDPIGRSQMSFGREAKGYTKDGFPIWGEWQLLSTDKWELQEVCDNKPPPPPPFPNPPPKRQKKMDACCRENLAFLRAIYTKLGLARFPGQLPNTIIQEIPKEGEQPAEPPQVPIPDLVSLLNWQFERDDERWGQWQVQIDIKDSDITKEGDQRKPIKLPNLAESIAEFEGQLLSIMTNVEALVALQVKNLAESGMARQEAIKGYLAAKSIIKYMAFKSTEVDIPVPMTFTAGAETISQLLEESEGHIKGTDYVEKETLRDVYLDLLQAAAIIRAVHWQRIDTKTDTKTQLLNILKGSVDLAATIIEKPQSPIEDGSEKAFKPEENFEDFIDAVENGFRNTTGITDVENPYGKSPDRRPRIRQIGDNISQAGGIN